MARQEGSRTVCSPSPDYSSLSYSLYTIPTMPHVAPLSPECVLAGGLDTIDAYDTLAGIASNILYGFHLAVGISTQVGQLRRTPMYRWAQGEPIDTSGFYEVAEPERENAWLHL